jgi:hypothetical protein
MSRRRRIPTRGDVAASLVAELLGLSLTDFKGRRPALRERGFPEGLHRLQAWVFSNMSNPQWKLPAESIR